MFHRFTILFIILLSLSLRILAQSTSNIVTLALPAYIRNQVNEDWFDDFEAEHEVQVYLIDSPEDAFVLFPHENHETQLNKLERLVTSADVMLLDDKMIGLHGSYANYFLNLAPLIIADRDINTEDFYPRIWEAFIWEDGQWAMPVSGTLMLWIYDAQAFDNAALLYPNPEWTIDDIAQAARFFTREENGQKIAGLSESYEDVLLSSLLSSTDINNLSSEDMRILETWTELRREGSVGRVFSNEAQAFFVSNIRDLTIYPHSNQNLQGALLSNEQAGLFAQGLAVSSGTEQPLVAYELTKYLSEQAEFIHLFEIPARQSMVFDYPSQIAELLDIALANAIPGSQSFMMEVLVNASHRAIQDSIPYSEALLLARVDWENSLASAHSRAENTIVVEAPFLPVLESDEIILRFGFDRGGWINVYNQELWRDLSEDFAMEHDRVGYVEFDDDMGYDGWPEDYDCVYTQLSLNTFDGESYLPLNPLLDADPNFNRNDILGTTLEQLQYEGNIIAYPLALFPTVLWYDPNELPIELDTGNWTLSEMLDTLNLLKETGSDPLALNEQIDMLIVNFGGIPIDYSTTPPTVNLLDEATINAIQQVLDLAKEDFLAYEALAPFDMAFSPALISTIEFSPFMLDETIDWGIKPFPTGTEYNAASYGIGAIYISAQSPYYNECYQFASTLAQHPEIMTGMPARASSIETVVNNGYHSANLSAFYTAYRDFLQAPNTVILPRPSEGNYEQFVLPYWVHRAYDRYVLEEADLRFELAQAQAIIDNYFSCINEGGIVDSCAANADSDFNPYE